MENSRLFLLDGMALLYRGHFAFLRNPRMTSTGLNTSTLFVFANTLLDIVETEKPSHLGVVFDTPEPTHRHKMYPEYKAQREAMPEDLVAALPYVDRLCRAFNVPVLRCPGWEADDVIGSLAKRAERSGMATFLVTPDKDFAQLVSDRTFIRKPGKASGETEILGLPEIRNQWQIDRTEQVIDILGLMGDTSDNVPGVPGIGPKTAQKLIARYGSLENLLDHLDELKGKQRETLETHREQALLSKKLVTIDCDVPLTVGLEDLAARARNDQDLQALFVELEFKALGKRIFGEAFAAGPQQTLDFGEKNQAADAAENWKTIGDVPHDYRLVGTPEKRAELIALLQRQPSLCFDTETTGLDSKRCELVGLAFCFEAHTGFYVPLPPEREKTLAVLGEFSPVFSDPGIEKIGHHLKYDLSVLLWHGVNVEGPLFDTMLAAYVAAPELRRTLDYLSRALLGYRPIDITALIGEKKKGAQQKSMRDVPLEEVAEYAAEDADITFQLAQALKPKIAEMGQERVFADIECPLVPVLTRMEGEGIRLDVETLWALSDELANEIARTESAIYDLAGETFNLNSPKQLGEILFDKLNLDAAARRTGKTKQYQTGEAVLQRLAYKNEIVEKILHYRTCAKLKSTYVDTLPHAVFPHTGRLHTHYEQAVTATGRLQSHDPNLQNIPIRTERGREIRKAFIPRGEEYLLLSADYSQIELRIAAELSSDETMMAVFRQGGDIHTATAVKIYGLDEAHVTAEMRRQAKTVNFGIIYGISAFGLAERLDISRFQASELIEQYFEQFPGSKRYMEETIAFASEHGFVETITGRRRYLRDIASRNATTRKAAERNAINSRIQGSAADLIKLAMIRIDQAFLERDLKTRMLLQVHDELVFDLHKDEQDMVPPLVEDAMKKAIPLRVPIAVEMGIGNNWLEAH